MTGPLSYEPSVRDLVANALPAGSRVLGEPGTFRARVSWPLLVRATATPEIEGGEVILAPVEYAEEVVARSEQLASMGVSAIVVERVPRLDVEPAVTVVELPPATRAGSLVEPIERFVARRRRELFALNQEMHHLLVDAALSGQPARAILTAAERFSGRTVLAALDGRPLDSHKGGSRPSITDSLHDGEADAPVEAGGLLLLPFYAGRERRGVLAMKIAGSPTTDDDEVVLASLASAMSIVAARDVSPPVPAAFDLLARMEAEQDTGEWTAVVVDAPVDSRRAARMVSNEIGGRDEHVLVGAQDGLIAAFLRASDDDLGLQLHRRLRARLSGRELRVGVGRRHRGEVAGRRSLEEALEAISHLRGDGCMRFDEIELQALLAGPRWQDFAERRLARLAAKRDGALLISTLRAYLAAGRNAKDAARAMGIHRNTMVYRLKAIKDCLEKDLDDPHELFALELALRVLDSR